MNDSECNSLELAVPGSGHIVKGYAMLDGPNLTGNITFVSSKSLYTTIYADNHAWALSLWFPYAQLNFQCIHFCSLHWKLTGGQSHSLCTLRLLNLFSVA